MATVASTGNYRMDVATPGTAEYEEWQRTNALPRDPYTALPNVSQFSSDQLAARRAYLRQRMSGTVPGAVPGVAQPGGTVPGVPGVPGAPAPVTPGDPFGDYLRNKPGARDSWAYLEALLDDYGLGSLAGFVKENIIEGRTETELIQRMRERDEYKTRFRAIEERKKAGLAPISEAEVISYERQARQLMRSAGLPEGFFDQPDDFVNFLKADISVAELGTRVNDGYVAVMNAPKEVRDYLEMNEGLTPGDMVAYFLDEQKALPVLERKVAAAKLGGAAARSGYGQLNRDEGEYLASLGVTDTQAQETFGTLTESRELFTPLSAVEDTITRDEQIKGTFGGNAYARERIEARRRKRQAEFAGSGVGYAADKTGFSGLGSASK